MYECARKTQKTTRMERWLVMRVTEYIHYITRTDLKLGRREGQYDYTHFTPWPTHKRQRYRYQCMLQGKEPIK